MKDSMKEDQYESTLLESNLQLTEEEMMKKAMEESMQKREV